VCWTNHFLFFYILIDESVGLGQELENFSVRDHIVNILGFLGRLVSVQLFHPAIIVWKQEEAIHK